MEHKKYLIAYECNGCGFKSKTPIISTSKEIQIGKIYCECPGCNGDLIIKNIKEGE
jgi:hypothetical protein